MKSRWFIGLGMMVFALSCESDADVQLPPGKYTGYFVRSTQNSNGTPSEVTLLFTAGTFTGSSDVPKYPAICEGTFSINEDKITFANSCPWTADFDWTLILSGEYTINVDGDQVKFFRDYDGAQADTYVLKKNN
jgi:hypothetical protein